VCELAPLEAAASIEPTPEAENARVNIVAETPNECVFWMRCGGCPKTKLTSFLIAYGLWSKTPT